MLYFTSEVFRRLANQNRGPIRVMLEFCIYRGLVRGYSYSNMTNYFKMNNYCKFYCKRFIVTTAIMNDNRE